MPFTIVRDDIAHTSADVVIVPANTSLMIDGGAGLAVAQVAGWQQLQAACSEIGHCEVGSVTVTPAFDFPARHVIHAVGPQWDGSDAARELLKSAYDQALLRAVELGAQSVVLPLISTGAYECPAPYSLRVALASVQVLLEDHADMDVCIVLFSDQAAYAGKTRFPGLQEYVDSAYVAEHENTYRSRGSYLAGSWAEYGSAPNNAPAVSSRPRYSAQHSAPRSAPVSAPARVAKSAGSSLGSGLGALKEKAQQAFSGRKKESASEDWQAEAQQFSDESDFMVGSVCESMSLGDMLDQIDAPFSTTLLEIIDARGLTDAQVYKRANLSRQHFSKIRSNPAYQPTKKTVLALAVALELTVSETEDLLERAGFALSHSSKMDVIVEWFIQQGNYDIFAINEALYAYDQPILG